MVFYRPKPAIIETKQDGSQIIKYFEDCIQTIKPEKRIKLNNENKSKKVAEKNMDIDKTVDYQIINNNYDSFTAVITLNCGERKEFGQNKYGPIVRNFIF